MTNDNATRRSRLSIWVQAIRVFSLTASLIPVLAGAALAVGEPTIDVVAFAPGDRGGRVLTRRDEYGQRLFRLCASG